MLEMELPDERKAKEEAYGSVKEDQKLVGVREEDRVR